MNVLAIVRRWEKVYRPNKIYQRTYKTCENFENVLGASETLAQPNVIGSSKQLGKTLRTSENIREAF